jgi:hypothetical protein
LRDKNITFEQYSAIRNFQKHGTPLEGYPPSKVLTDIEKAQYLISAGMSLGIFSPNYYPTFTDPDIKIINAAYPKREK